MVRVWLGCGKGVVRGCVAGARVFWVRKQIEKKIKGRSLGGIEGV